MRQAKDARAQEAEDFMQSLAALSDEEYVKQAETLIWLSAFANNNPRSKYHWQADACYDEAKRRGQPELYSRAWRQAARTLS